MAITDDFWRGFFIGIELMIVAAAFFSIGSCSRVYTRPYVPPGVTIDKATRECVIKWDRVASCYDIMGE